MESPNLLEWIDRVLKGRFQWMEHESAAWTTTHGFGNFSFRCKVKSAALPLRAMKDPSAGMRQEWPWWRWKVSVTADGVTYRVSAYADSMDDGKFACERAVKRMALAATLTLRTT